MRILVISMVYLVSISIMGQESAESRGERPNILFIMSDDHAAHAISAYGSHLAETAVTANLDRLADEGMLFTKAFCVNSICTPSRATLMTGTWSHVNGVYKFTALDQSQPTLPKLMQEAGYRTGFVGKWHLHSNPVGFDHWSVLPGQGKYHHPEFVERGDEHESGRVRNGKRTRYQGHSSDVITDKALADLKWFFASRNKHPFFYMLHYKAPHDTWEYAPRYESYLADVSIPEPVTLFDDYASRSDALKKSLQYIGSRWGHHTDFLNQTSHLIGKEKLKAQYQLYMKKYLRCVKGIDDNIGRVLQFLEDTGMDYNTIVIYTSDQGFFLGEHKLYDKRFMYEEALRIPLIVRWPEVVAQGVEKTDMVLNADFAPTLLSLAGAAIPDRMQGRSFFPILQGNVPADWRTSFYYRYYRSHFETEEHLGIRTQSHKLIFFNHLNQWEMYDLGADPHEVNNLYGKPEQKELVEALKSQLFHLQAQLGDSLENDGSLPITGFE